MNNSLQKAVYAALGEGVMAYHPELARALRSVKAAILLGQLLYWYGKGSKGNWVYKTMEEMRKETGLSRSEQDTAIASCKRLGVLRVKNKGIPQKRHFMIEVEALLELISNVRKTSKLGCSNQADSDDEKPHSITESIQRNTSKNRDADPKIIRKGISQLAQNMRVK